HKAREIAAAFGYPAKPADSTIWLEHRPELLLYLKSLPAPQQWTRWLAAEAPIRAVYREGPAPLLGTDAGQVEAENPPTLTPGMINVTLDGYGKLLNFAA